MSNNNFYKILGVQRHATQDEIRKAFRRIVKRYHPDVNKEPDAEERMKNFNEAYAVLSDSEKRQQFDNEPESVESQQVRSEKQKRRSERTRYHSPRYEQAPSPAQPQQHKRDMPYAAGLFVFILILVFMWGGTPQATPVKQQVVTPVSPVVLVTPQQPVTQQKTFEIWKGEGDTLMGQDRTGDALAAYDRALEIRPNASKLWVTEGDIYSTMGYFEKAIACYDQALKTNPQIGEQVQKKSWVLTNINSLMEFADRNVEQENYSAAIDMYDNILSAGIKNSNFQKRVLSAKVFVLMRSGKTDEANRISRSIQSL
jgi:tetratricopeptide (TPR) repeat protein